jgi:hypothetical protein
MTERVSGEPALIAAQRWALGRIQDLETRLEIATKDRADAMEAAIAALRRDAESLASLTAARAECDLLLSTAEGPQLREDATTHDRIVSEATRQGVRVAVAAFRRALGEAQ